MGCDRGYNEGIFTSKGERSSNHEDYLMGY